MKHLVHDPHDAQLRHDNQLFQETGNFRYLIFLFFELFYSFRYGIETIHALETCCWEYVEQCSAIVSVVSIHMPEQ
jgi:hypothetical protein